jgi:hypothetical protein
MTSDAQFLSGQKLKQSSILLLFANKKGLTVWKLFIFLLKKLKKMAIVLRKNELVLIDRFILSPALVFFLIH